MYHNLNLKIMKFKKITKKQFIEDMTASSVIFVQGGFTARVLEDECFESRIIEYCESIYADEEEQCTCVNKSNRLERINPDGSISTLYFDTKSEKSYYEYGNIRIVEQKYEDSERRNYIIYLCV